MADPASMATAPAAPLRRRVIASYLGSGWSALIALAFVPFYVQLLGIESYGLIGFFATLQAWLSVLDMGLSGTLNREITLFITGSRSEQGIRDLLRSIETVYFSTACALGFLVAALSSVIGSYWLKPGNLGADAIADAVLLMALVLTVQWGATLYRSGLLGLQRHVWLSAVGSAIATVRSAGSVLVLLRSPTIASFFIFQALVSAVETTLLGLELHRRLPPAPTPPSFRASSLSQVLQFAGGLSLISLLATLLTQLDKVLLSKLLPLDQFGSFMLMVTATSAISLVTVPIHNVALSRLSEVAASQEGNLFSGEYHKFAQMLSIGALPVALLLIFFAQEILVFWTHDAVLAASVAPLLRIWALGTALNSLTHVPHMAQVAHGWTRLGVGMSGAMVAITVPLLLLLVPHYGAMAAAWIWVLVNTSYIVVAIPLMHARILHGEKRSWYLRDVLTPLTAGAAVGYALKITGAGSHPLALALGAGLMTLAVVLATDLGRQTVATLFRRLLRK